MKIDDSDVHARLLDVLMSSLLVVLEYEPHLEPIESDCAVDHDHRPWCRVAGRIDDRGLTADLGRYRNRLGDEAHIV
jgi:hypothetical protein